MARRINLVPSSERARTTTNVASLAMVAAVIIVIFGIGLGYYMLQNDLDNRKDELAGLEQEVQTLRSQVAALSKYDVLAGDRQRAEAIVQEIYAGRTLVSDFLNSLSLVMPENVWLNTLSLSAGDPGSLDPGTLDLDGQTYSFEDVAQVLVRLKLIPGVFGVGLNTASDAGTGADVKSFSVSASLEPPLGDALLPVSLVELD